MVAGRSGFIHTTARILARAIGVLAHIAAANSLRVTVDSTCLGDGDCGRWCLRRRNDDWYKHRGILLQLSRGDWPTELASDLRDYLDAPIVLRHYLAFYMVPGLIGRWLGPAALNWAVPLWTWCGVSLIVVMFTGGYRGWWALGAGLVLVFFSGMDILRFALLEGSDWFEFTLRLDGWPHIAFGRSHIEWEGTSFGKYQYTSNMVGLMWVPTHFIAGALFTLLLVQLRSNRRFLAVCGVLLATTLFWSPFVVIGLSLFVLVLIAENGIRSFLHWQNLLCTLPLTAFLFVFLSSGSEGIERGWIWERYLEDSSSSLLDLPILFLSEFLLLAILLLLLRNRLRRDLLFLVCLATLLSLPLFTYGRNNDLVMRGMMPALFLLSYYCAGAIFSQHFNVKRNLDYRALSLVGLIVTVLAIGAVTPMLDLTRANNQHDFRVIRYEELGSDYSILHSTSATGHPRQNASNDFPDWYSRLLRLDEIDSARTKDELVIRSTYNVYAVDQRLIFVRTPCLQDEEGTRFFVHVVPVDESELPDDRAHDNMDFRFSRTTALQLGETCYVISDLPNYVVGHITAGQLNAAGTAHLWLGRYYSEDYRSRLLAEAGEPIIPF